jgi:hypothetical protein
MSKLRQAFSRALLPLTILPVLAVTAFLLFVTRPSVQAGSEPAIQDVLAVPKVELGHSVPTASAGIVATTTIYLPMVLNKYPPPPSVLGVQMVRGINNAGGLAQVLQAGVDWVRFGAFDWSEIEPVRTEPPTYDWSVVSEQGLLNAASSGLEVIAIVQFAPEWAQSIPGYACGPILQDRLDEYAQFLRAVVTRYSAPPYDVRYWELGNEPDIAPELVAPGSGFGCWGDESAPYYGGSYYAQMLKVAYPAIKAVDPKAQVLIGGLLIDCDPQVPGACSDPKPPLFLEGILANGGGDYFDVVSFHAYSYYDWGQGLGHMGNTNWPGSITSIPEKAQFVRDVLDRYGYGSKSLMNTESALLCYMPADECFVTQAMYVPRAYAEALAFGLKSQIYYAIINDWWWHTGLLLPDLTPKPAYDAYQAAASLLSSADYESPVVGYPAGIQGYTFLDGITFDHVDVIWSSDGSTVALDLPAGGEAYDYYGNFVASSGTIYANYSPLYVVRP